MGSTGINKGYDTARMQNIENVIEQGKNTVMAMESIASEKKGC